MHYTLWFRSHLNFNQGKGLRLLPHQHVKYSKGLPSGIIHRGMGGFFTNLLAGSSFGNINPTKIICNQSEETKSDISKSNKNLLKFSPTMATKTTTAANTCIGCSPDGLKTTAISMNLSLGSICSNAGCVGASYKDKDGSSSNRASRSASPALGNPTEINRFNWFFSYRVHIFKCFDCCFPDSCYSSTRLLRVEL